MMKFRKCRSRSLLLPLLGLSLAGVLRVEAQPGSILWSFTTTDPILASPAVGADGTIYVGSYDRNLYAITPTGEQKWAFSLPTSGYTGIYSSPALGSDGTIYFGAEDGYLYALNPANGSSKWVFHVGDAAYSDPAVGLDGTIYIGSYDLKGNNTAGTLFAINPDGTERWHYDAADAIFSDPVIAADGTVYFGCDDGGLYALNSNGTLRWKFNTGPYAITASPAIGRDGKVYIGVGVLFNPRFYCVNPDGTTNWIFTTTRAIQSSAALGDDGTIYFGSDDNHLYVLNPNGTLKWSVLTGGNNGSSPALLADGTILMGCDDGKLYAFDGNGSNLWSFATGNFVYSSPAIAADGTVYVGSADYHLYALSGSCGLARTPWPMFRHDVRHTARFVTLTNTPPTISSITDQTINENAMLGPLAFTVADAETPAGNLMVSGSSSNTVLVPNSQLQFSGTGSNRFLTLTPVANQSGTATITLTVTDSRGATSSSHFLLTVRAVNSAPVLPAQSDLTLAESGALTVTNTATDADSPAQTLGYTLSVTSTAGGVSNAAISADGVITWTPTEAQGPSTNLFTTVVTDNGSPPRSATNAFTVVVTEVNTAPVLTLPGPQTVDELTTLNVNATATDADHPTNTLTFALVAGPAGLTVSLGGAIAWTPAEDQGPGTNDVTVRVFDNGTPSLSATQSFVVVVREVNTPPVFTPVPDRTIHQGMTLSLSLAATDDDIPANHLTYTLAGAPNGANLNLANGFFTWTPAEAQANSTNVITVIATDNGVPSLSATNTFSITVVSRPFIQSIVLTGSGLDLSWSSIPGLSYRLQYQTNLPDAAWADLPGDVTATASSTMATAPLSGGSRLFYRVAVVP